MPNKLVNYYIIYYGHVEILLVSYCHDSDIEVFHDDIIGACLTAAKRIMPLTQPYSNTPGTRIGWNEFVASDVDHAMPRHA